MQGTSKVGNQDVFVVYFAFESHALSTVVAERFSADTGQFSEAISHEGLVAALNLGGGRRSAVVMDRHVLFKLRSRRALVSRNFPKVLVAPSVDSVLMDAVSLLGVNGVIHSALDSNKLKLAIEMASAGQSFVCMAPHATSAFFPPLALEVSPVGTELSPREKQVANQVARGQSNKQIADLLGLSERTIKVYVSRVLGKLSARNRSDVVGRFDQTAGA